ncbi:hypothetical protein BJD60_gp68 [Gordonia phage Schnabeltier]|uniref:Uncharacterized protein n=1 Tax=Gordonia phage Schnabeltier TaxID=1821561 RepID=A0A142KA56_9CAUD|nr:hypothetical protein BJD60_gp68 [Gordonia phage Schnabeltier]AMS02989.1 hypothetical protein SEA_SCHNABELTIER_68 [Gordonia phage Schnabeltier]
MHGTDELIGEIDTLIADQLAAGEPMNGYDFDDPDFPTCWHCGRDWHGLAITERMNEMRALGAFDEGYRYADDDSAVSCPGSSFIGPVQTPPRTERLDFRMLAPYLENHAVAPANPFVGLYQQSQSFAIAYNEAVRGFAAHMNQLAQLIWEDLRGGLTVWGFDLGEWTPANAPTTPAPALPDVRELKAEGWRPVGYVREGFVFEIDEPQMDEAGAQVFRELMDARACESTREPEAPASPLTLPVSPVTRRPSRPPFWAARMDGRR